MSDTSKTGKTLPEEIAAAAGMPAGKAAGDVGTGGVGHSGLVDLDPLDKASDFSLKPDPLGAHDPIGRPDRAAPAPSAGGKPDFAGLSESAQAAAGRAADRVADLAGSAQERASALADDVRDRLSGAADAGRARTSEALDGAKTWVSGVHQEHMRRIDDAVVRSSDGFNRSRTAVEQFVSENPLLVGVVGVAAGLLLGALLPRTRQEDRSIGPYADEVRDQGLRYAREFTSRGREFVETALDPDNIQAAAQKAASN
ncbi:hypothetical protein [uncultured Methylobacterium sp.]|uniref:hypothetical protein n=1 Tax=uncultured Methylobacterium sp. TaxID=157278 RepID=UPI0035CAABA0